MTKVIIAGSRNFDDFELLEQEVDKILDHMNLSVDIEIVSGKARGADELGESFAEKYGLNVKHFPADWDKFGTSAGYIRNAEMAKYADVLIAFWDGKSLGTRHMIKSAEKKGLEVHVIRYKGCKHCGYVLKEGKDYSGYCYQCAVAEGIENNIFE